MKRNLRMSNSLMPGLIQEDKIFKSWALYMSKYLSAYIVVFSTHLCVWCGEYTYTHNNTITNTNTNTTTATYYID